MSALAVIGTAGRGSDAQKLTVAHYRMMCVIAQTVATMTNATRLVSGGSSWSDHTAVSLYLEDTSKFRLSLHLPAPFILKHPLPQFDHTVSDGRRLNELHQKFHETTGIDPFMQLTKCVANSSPGGTCDIKVNSGGFKARNVDVANEADVLLAFTFSGGALPADGGTAHTWGLFKDRAQREFDKARDHYEESPCGCSCNQPPDDWFVAYHFDLVSRKLYRHVHEDAVRVRERAEHAKMWEKLPSYIKTEPDPVYPPTEPRFDGTSTL